MINIPKLRGKLAEKEISVTELATDIGVSASTLYSKLNGQGATLTIEEVVKIATSLALTKEEFNNIFFADFVA